MLNDTNPTELYNMEKSGNSFINTKTTTRRSKVRINYYDVDNAVISYQDFFGLGVAKHKITINVPENTKYIALLFIGTQLTQPSFRIKYSFEKVGQYALRYEIIANDYATIGGYIVKDIMITLTSESDTSYTPYAMGNQELTQRLLSLESRVAALEG